MTPARRRALLATAALFSAPALTQTPAPTPSPTPTAIPGLDDFSLPGAATPTPAPTTVPTVALPPLPAATPTPAGTPTPRATPSPRPTATPTPPSSPEPAPEAIPTAAPAPAPLPTPGRTVAPMPAPAVKPNGEAWPWWLGGGALALLAGLLAWRALRRRDPEAERSWRPDPPPEPDPEPEPRFLTPPPPPASRAHLALDFRPIRAGLNLLSATVECEVAVTNTGDAPATGVRLAVRLLSAHAGQDADLAAFRAQPVARPVAPPFALAPGETRRVRAVAALPHAEIRPLGAGARPSFVPLVALNALYRAAEGVDGQTAQAFAVGLEREGADKLAPFRLDQTAPMTDRVAARPAAPAIAR